MKHFCTLTCILLTAFITKPSIAQHKNYFTIQNQYGYAFDGKGDLFGQSFANGITYYVSKNHSIKLMHEFFSLNNDLADFFKHRKTNGVLLGWAYSTDVTKSFHGEFLVGVNAKSHVWRYSTRNVFAVIGVRDGLLRLQPNDMVLYAENSFGYTISPMIFKKIKQHFHIGLGVFYQNDNQGYSVLTARLSTKIKL